MQANRIQLSQPHLPQPRHHQLDGRVLAASAVTFTVLAVWMLSSMHFDNQALDAIPATASLARDIAVGIGAIVWEPLAALAAVVITGILIVAIGRAALKQPKAA